MNQPKPVPRGAGNSQSQGSDGDLTQIYECSICRKRTKTARGLQSHITRLHPRLQQGPQVTDVTTDARNNFSDFYQQPAAAKSRIRLVKIIPRVNRGAVSKSYGDVLNLAVQKNDEASWIRLLSFPYIVFRLPVMRYKSKKLCSIIFDNLAKYKEGLSLEEVLQSYPRLSFPSEEHNCAKIAKAAEAKLGEGDVRSAVRIITSTDKFAEYSEETLNTLREKHPQMEDQPQDGELQLPSLTSSLEVSPIELIKAIRGFPKASGSGPDGLRPRHLLDMISKDNPYASQLLDHLSGFIEMIVNGKLPETVLATFYSATLTALRKHQGGIRPIACGLTLRRLAAKVAIAKFEPDFLEILLPHQVGVGVPGGAEAVIHAVRAYLSDEHNETKLLVKLDFENAFNTVSRRLILAKVSQHLPDLYPMIFQSYGAPSHLIYGESFLRSSRGVQQGDPLGPALFCLAIADLVNTLQSEIKPWYLDDGTLIGNPEAVYEDLERIKEASRETGLKLNSGKCEALTLGGTQSERMIALRSLNDYLPSAKFIEMEDLELLGLPLSASQERTLLEKKVDMLNTFGLRLQSLHPQSALYLLRYSLGIPRVIFLLRGSPCYQHPELLEALDSLFRSMVVQIINVSLDTQTWTQASLPFRYGGIGVRKPSSLALPAYLGSLVNNAERAKSLLPTSSHHLLDSTSQALKELYVSLYNHLPETLDQRSLDNLIIIKVVAELEMSFQTEPRRKAIFLAAKESFGYRFLQALPSPQTGTMLDITCFRMAVGLRLGAAICEAGSCALCGKDMDSSGDHALSCTRGLGRRPRHSAINQEVGRALSKAGIPSRLEPPGLTRIDARRPDGVSLINCERGKLIAWDATVVCTTAGVHIHRTAKEAGAAAEQAALDKCNKYRDLGNEFSFTPLCFETHGPISTSTKEFLKEIGKRLHLSSGDPRQGKFLEQRIALAIARGNSASVLGALGNITTM